MGEAAARQDPFRDTFEHLHVGVLVQGRNSEILLSNPMALELLGLTEDQLLGRSSFDPSWNVIHEDGSPFPGDTHPVPVAIAERRPVRSVVMGVQRPARGDRVWLLVNAEPELDEDGNVLQVFCTFTDITERKRLERAFVEAQKLEVVGRLAGGIAHDFNNLLCVMMGLADSVMRRLPTHSREHADLAMMVKAAERGAGLTRQLLAFAGKNHLAQPRLVSVPESLRAVRSLVAPLMGDAIDLEVLVDDPDLVVRIDPTGLEQVLLNLALNARDALPRGGSLRLHAGRVALADDNERGLPAGEYVTLSVTDTGVGIPPEALPRVFEAFFTTKGAGRGTGLGLPMVQEVVRASGGAAWIESAVGAGTTAHVLLPRAASQPSAAHPSSAGRASGRERILLVEDDSVLREVVARHLRELGYEVLVAEDGAAALETLADHRVHLVLSDVLMPKLDAGRMMRAMESIAPDAKLLLMSGYTDVSLAELGIDLRHVDLLRKPFTPTELADRVRAALDDYRTP